MITIPGWSSAGDNDYDNDFYNHDQVMTIIFMQMITSTMSMMSRLAARILAKKLLEGEGFEEGDRLKEIQEKVVDLDDDDDGESFTGWCGGWSDGREGGQCSSPRGLHSRRGFVCNLVDLNIKATHCSPGD